MVYWDGWLSCPNAHLKQVLYVLNICMSQFKWENIDLLTPYGLFKIHTAVAASGERLRGECRCSLFAGKTV